MGLTFRVKEITHYMKGHSGTIVQEIGFRSCSPTFSFESSCAFLKMCRDDFEQEVYK